MFIYRIRMAHNLLITVLLSLTVSTGATELYQPKVTDPILEPWCWDHLEEMDGQGFECMAESPNGTMWFGTSKGILAYADNQWTRYQDTDGLGPGRTLAIVATQSGDIYAQTVQRICKLVEQHWQTILEVPTHLYTNEAFIEAQDGTLWAGTSKGLVSIVKDRPTLYDTAPNPIWSLCEDQEGSLWCTIGRDSTFYCLPTMDGMLSSAEKWCAFQSEAMQKLSRHHIKALNSGLICITSDHPAEPCLLLDPITSTWKTIDLHQAGGTNNTATILETRDNTLWIAGLNKLHFRHQDQWQVITSPPFKLPSAKLVLLETRDGSLWIGGVGAEVYRIDRGHRWWRTYQGLHFHAESQDGRRWYIHRNGAIVVQQPDRTKWLQYKTSDNAIDTPVALLITQQGHVWAAGSHQGIAATAVLYDGHWARHLHPELGFGISYLSALEGIDGELFFGCAENRDITPHSEGGMIIYRWSDNQYHKEHIPATQTRFRVVGLAQTPDKSLWIGGGGGLLQYDMQKAHTILSPPSIADNWIDHVTTSVNGELWVAKSGSGVFRYQDQAWQLFTTQDGLASNMASYILCDRDHTAWVGTSSGISRFDGRSWTQFALPSYLTMPRETGTLKQSPDGTLWINRTTRDWYFRGLTPIDTNTVFYECTEYRPGRTPPETELTFTVDRLTTPGNTQISWTGRGAEFRTPPHALQYSYRMNDEPWSAFTEQTSHTYLNLPHGQHRFAVRARDRDFNVDPTPAQFTLTVALPTWKQPWFMVLIGGGALLIVTLALLLIRAHEKHLVEIEHVKLQFFTNISHELRTPLTVILGPLERCLQEVREDHLKQRLTLAYQNAQQMLHLVDELLDFRKLQSGKLTLEISEADLVALVRTLTDNLQPLAEQKGLQYQIVIPENPYRARFDTNKIQKILSNLLTNAIRYTQAPGQVCLSLTIETTDTGHQARFIVEDSGMGINAKDLPHIYKRFYQTKGSKQSLKGSGIGLALTKELVSLSGGTIHAVSPIHINPKDKHGPGTRFTVILPLADAHTSPSPETTERLLASEESDTAAAPKPALANLSHATESRPNDAPPLILVVEDNADVRGFIRDELADSYEIHEAADGIEGLALARELTPDLILADIMMPRMDGIELCRTLKQEDATNHIPIIILTARQSQEHELEGLHTGADDYITKPFQIPLLEARIHNQLQARRRLREHLQRELLTHPSKIKAPSPDERFLQRMKDILEANISEEQFDVDAFAAALNMSRSSLYRKLKAVVNQSPASLMRAFRLRRAADLLQTGQYTVSEVSHKTGFSDLSYFSASFKEHYQCTPSQYAAKTHSDKTTEG